MNFIRTLKSALTKSGCLPASARPVTHRLLPPLAALVLLIFAGAGTIIWQQHRAQLSAKMALLDDTITHYFNYALEKQAEGLATALQPIAADARVGQALRDGDSDRLLADWGDLFATMHREHDLTHFYFFDSNRVCLLRLHKPEKAGDTINRFTALEAERTGKTASGLELGPLNTFTLRVVQPVFDGATLVGYVELGKEIEDLLGDIHRLSGGEVAVALHKEAISRKGWEEGMRMLGREADWERLPHSVIIYASQGRLPEPFAPLVEHNPTGDHTHPDKAQELVADGKVWRTTTLPLQEVSGKEVGDLMVMHDVSADKNAFRRTVVLVGVSGAVLQAALLGLVFVMLRRADAGIRAQEKALRHHNDELSRLNVVMAHHFQEPSRRLVTLAGQLRRPEGAAMEGHSRQQALEFIEQQARYLNRLVHDILRYLKIGTDSSPSMILDSRLALERALGRMGAAIEEAGAMVSSPDPLPPVRFQTDYLEMIFTILIDNALAYRRADRPLRLEIRAETAEKRVRFCCRDNGQGIAEPYREQVLDLFSRLGGKSADSPGTGVGLAIVRKVVELSGGEVTIEDGIDGGVGVVFDLPAGERNHNRVG